jgi:HD superfamily phosphohydrolase
MQYAGKLVVNDKPYYTYKLRKTGSLITKYVDCYFDSVTRLYDEALKYCSKYENNEAQIRRFSELYATLVTTNLKQISCNKDLSNKQKRELISNICDNPKLRKAMTVSKLEKKKSFVKSFVLSRNINAIILMYKLIGGASGYQRK